MLGAAAGLLAANPNTTVFIIGLCVLCASVAQWSGPLAGVIAGLAMMAVAVRPFVARRSAD